MMVLVVVVAVVLLAVRHFLSVACCAYVLLTLYPTDLVMIFLLHILLGLYTWGRQDSFMYVLRIPYDYLTMISVRGQMLRI